MLADVNTVLEMAKKNKYSVSKVYAAYNAVTGKTDPPQTCNSCVRNRVAYLRKWHAEYVERTSALLEQVDPIGTPDADTAPPSEDERPDGRVDPLPDGLDVTGFPEPPIDVILLHVPVLELPVYFTANDKDPAKGKVMYQGGGAIKPGKYITSDDRELAVQPGGKATLKAAPADNDLL